MPLVPKHIKKLPPYKFVKPVSEIQCDLGLERVIKLDLNENPLGPSPKVVEAAKKSLQNCHRYPDSGAFELRTRLAECFNLNISNVILGIGSEGVMSNIMRTFLGPDDELIGAQNSFIGFRILAKASGVRKNWIPMKNYQYDLQAIADAINEYTKIIYLANPDNPTGSYFSIDEFDAFMKKVPDRVLVILDEAYFEYVRERSDYPDSTHYRYDNLITLRTFSKAYGMAGFRVGYGLSHENLINNLLKIKLLFEPSAPAQAAAVAALDDEDYLKISLVSNNKGRKLLEETFQELELQYLPSVTNFITLVFENEKSAAEFTRNMLHRGVILRHLDKWGLPECVRVTIGKPEENKFFIEQLSDVTVI